MKKINILLPLIILVSCANVKPKYTKGIDHEKVEQPSVVYKEVVKYKEKELESLKSYTINNMDRLELHYHKKHFDFWVKYFTEKQRDLFIRYVNNGAKYRNVIEKIMRSHGLPEDLFFVGLIESGYNTFIKSKAAAVGPWQFIKATGKRYKLRVDSYVDERTHIIKSTEAAAQYFKDLYNIFGSWELALVAYNKGEYGIIRSIRKGKTRDYMKLVSRKLIPTETIYYVPKVAAVREIYNNPEKYGIKITESKDSPFEKVKAHRVSSSFNLYKFAKARGISAKTLKVLNPDLKRKWIKVNRRRAQDIFLPSSNFTDYKSLAEYETRKYLKGSASSSSKTAGVYRVRRGDNLSTIASRLGVRVSDLKRINGIRGSKILVGQRLKYSTRGEMVTHRVRRGDNLIEIARRYGVSVRSIKSLNGLRSSKIFIGQKLKIASNNAKRVALKKYRVRRGDNLTAIARKFKTSIRKIKKVNSIRGSALYAGQVIKVPSEG
ncbi:MULTISPECIES: LysM peptidoglycan-binding domain-containing protein [Halobacteriovorax]|uniref:LysM peptidoglycan-binding domain-containing protein n=1 Tax=Halobacteriovorax vibrionivorans TaxID=2152716 RepID=A0ABY0IIC1_9BACT|nr:MULTISPECIES: LysM peptidoglycan-binding domain-containing protein [Halobacteriovorax]AYF44186.1 LysM domain protein [Halobacteriovorax sp. BALOs_7]RZF21294.1 LysM peptidoglycan-binding domain-containing protein [Halobacteriovorax vibrionivorans]TGD47948.1 LysM peptidoglycan-binding domain-containing protein [Halobacteriovorax sp. Y22]